MSSHIFIMKLSVFVSALKKLKSNYSLAGISLLATAFGAYKRRRLWMLLGCLGLSSQVFRYFMGLWLKRGPHASIHSILTQTPTPTTIGGTVDPRFERVREAFRTNFLEGHELGAQLVVYYKGEKVIDLWGRGEQEGHGIPSKDKRAYDAESLQVVFSCSKVITSICVALAVERGWLDYNTAISKYWPAFGNNGKAAITVADLMRHEAGLSFLTPFRRITTKDIGNPALLASLFEASSPTWSPGSEKRSIADMQKGHQGSRRSYHAYTRGFIVNEIFKRAEPRGRSVGRFLHDEVAVPLGLTEHLFMGNLPESSPSPRDRFVQIAEAPQVYALSQVAARLQSTPSNTPQPSDSSLLSSSLPASSASLIDKPTLDARIENFEGPLSPDAVRRLRHVVTNPHSDVRKGLLTTPYLSWLNSRQASKYEMPSVGVISNARALAFVAEMMRAGGLVNVGSKVVRVSSEKGVADGVDLPITRYDSLICGMTSMTQAGLCWFEPPTFPSYLKGFVGWGGIGGSLMAWSPSLEIAIAYSITGHAPPVTSMFGATDFRCCRLLKSLLECLQPSQSKL